jgi:hypothetical protein
MEWRNGGLACARKVEEERVGSAPTEAGNMPMLGGGASHLLCPRCNRPNHPRGKHNAQPSLPLRFSLS